MSGHTPWSQVKAERQARREREAFERRLKDELAAAERLHDALGLPPGLSIEYSRRPLAANDAANPSPDDADPE